jgi:uncharacterized membrane protein
VRSEVALVVAAMAAVTALTRLAGVWGGRGPLRETLTRGAVSRWLAHLPGAVLVAIAAPLAARGGTADTIAALVALAVAARTRSPLAAVAVGVVAAAWLRR